MKKVLASLLLTAPLIAPVAITAFATYSRWDTTPTFYVNPANQDGLAAADVEAAVQAGLNVWIDQTGSSFEANWGGRVSDTSANIDYRNVVIFRNATHPNTANAIATTYSWWDGSGNLVDADIVFWDAARKFFTGTSGCASGAYIEDIAAHEFGHAIGLDHSGITEATMHASYGTCSQKQRTLAADDIAATLSLYPASSGGSNTTPAVTILNPTSGTSVTQGTTLTFSATATDAQDGNVASSLAWTSSLEGSIGSGGAFSTVLSTVGTHTITATARDSQGLQDVKQVTLTVLAPVNAPPTVTIAAPGAGAGVEQNVPVTFAGSATDPQDGNVSASITWTSNLEGILGTGPSVSKPLTTAGTHTITARATDTGGLVSTAQVSITVSNTAPVVAISTPVNALITVQGTVLTFAGTARDTQQGALSASLVWTSSIDGPIGTGSLFSRTLTTGTHTITARATDSGGLQGSAQITVTVTPPSATNTKPVVSIHAPASGATAALGTSFVFSGTAVDAEDGNISAALIWTSNLDGVLGRGASFSRALSAGTHTITTRASDSSGVKGYASISLIVTTAPTTNTRPVITIMSPASGSTVTPGTVLAFNGSALDAEDGNLSAAMIWTSNVDGLLGRGAAFARALSAGTHTITARAADSTGVKGYATITVTVQ